MVDELSVFPYATEVRVSLSPWESLYYSSVTASPCHLPSQGKASVSDGKIGRVEPLPQGEWLLLPALVVFRGNEAHEVAFLDGDVFDGGGGYILFDFIEVA